MSRSMISELCRIEGVCALAASGQTSTRIDVTSAVCVNGCYVKSWRVLLLPMLVNYDRSSGADGDKDFLGDVFEFRYLSLIHI